MVEESPDGDTRFVRLHPDDEESCGAREPDDDEQDEEIPELSLPMTLALVVATVFIAITAEWVINSIDGLASGGGILKEFIGLIPLPMVGNTSEHATTVTLSAKDKLMLSLGIAVGSSIVCPFASPQLRLQQRVTSSPPSKFRCLSSHSSSSWVDHMSPDHDALRPVRAHRALLPRADH